MEKSGDQQLVTFPANLHEKRRSCELSQVVAPCIEKVVTHLYNLEDKLIDAFQEDAKIRKSDQNSPGQEQSWLLTAGPDSERNRTVMSASGAALEIAGIGLAKSHESDAEPSLAEFGEQVIKETLLLIGRIETDRVNTQHSLAKEKQRVAILKGKIMEYTHRRMHFMPIAVQEEHELCTINIQELKWHIAYKGRARDRIREKFQHAEKVNKKLKEEIEYIKEQRPWIEAKLEEERSQVDEIKKQLYTIDTELMGAFAMLKSMEEKFSRAEQKAEKARQGLEKDVNAVRDQLNKDTEELSRYKMHFTSFVHSIHDANERLREMEEESQVLVTRYERAVELHQIHEEKINVLKGKVQEQGAEKAKLLEENSKLEMEKDERKSELESKNEFLGMDVKKQTKKLREMLTVNRALDREIRIIRKNINESLKEKADGEKTVKRTEMEMARIDSEAKVLGEDLSKVALVHDKLQTTLEREQRKCGKTEEDLTTTAMSLKKQLRDEAHARTVLHARFAADTSDLVKRKITASKKREKNTKKAAEIEKAVENARKQVEKMEKAHAERAKVISELDSLLEKARRHQKNVEDTTKNKIGELEPKEQDTKEKLQSLIKQLEDMDWRTEAIEKRMDDMSSSSLMMNRVLLSTQESIEELSDELNELMIQLHAGQGISETLENTLAQLKERSSKSAKDHSHHLQKRDKRLQLLQDEIKQSLEENTELAKEYTSTQNHFMQLKNTLLKAYEVAVFKQSSLKDRKELFDFRTRLHTALECYYKLRGAQTRAGILRFEQMVDENGQRLNHIEDSLKGSLKQITEFMEVNNSSHNAIRTRADEIASGAIDVSA